MEGPLQIRALLLILASATAVLGQMDAREVVRRAVAADARNWKAARNYSFSERVDLRRLDAQGQVKSQEVKVNDVMLLDGSPYRRLVARDDRPLPPAEERKEREKLARSVVARREETPAQRLERLAEYGRRPDWQREAWHELPDAFDFSFGADEAWDGRDLYVIEATPRRGYEARSRTAKVLAHIRARLWVNKRDDHLLKAEVEVIDTISVGLFLVRLAPGSRASFEQTLVNDEVWLPRQVRAFVSARLGLLAVLRIEQETNYTNCRDSQTDSPVISQMKPR